MNNEIVSDASNKVKLTLNIASIGVLLAGVGVGIEVGGRTLPLLGIGVLVDTASIRTSTISTWPPPPQPTTPQHLRIHGGVVLMGVDLPYDPLSNGPCSASGRL